MQPKETHRINCLCTQNSLRYFITCSIVVISTLLAVSPTSAADVPGVVSNIKVISDKVEDVTTLEDWKRTYIKEGMSDQEKAVAIWKTIVKYRHQTTPAITPQCISGNFYLRSN